MNTKQNRSLSKFTTPKRTEVVCVAETTAGQKYFVKIIPNECISMFLWSTVLIVETSRVASERKQYPVTTKFN